MKNSNKGFTLIELLTVIAIIGILAAIIIPTTGAVRNSAKKAQTRSQFSNWIQAMTLFKQEYGFYPSIDKPNDSTADNRDNKVYAEAFYRSLVGRNVDGTTLATSLDTRELYGNRKRASFYTISDGDMNAAGTALVDAFGNTDIAVIYDKNGDGRITTADLSISGSNPPDVDAIAGGQNLQPDFTLSATEGPRAPVIFYTAGRGGSAGDIVYSFK